MSANEQMDSKKLFQFHRPRTEVQPSPFDVQPGKSSIFATPAAMRYAKTSAASSAANSARQSLAPHVKPYAHSMRDALLRIKPMSNFNCDIATQSDSDKTVAIAGRRL